MHKFLPFFIILTGCTYSINMAHTEGTATDLIDENQTASPDVSPNIEIPLSSMKSFSNGPSAPHYVGGKPRNLTGPIGSS